MSGERTHLVFADVTYERLIERAATLLDWATNETDLARLNSWAGLADSYITLAATIKENDG